MSDLGHFSEVYPAEQRRKMLSSHASAAAAASPVPAPAPAAVAPSSKPLSNVWQEFKDDDGRTYYYNRETRERSWSVSPELLKQKKRRSLHLLFHLDPLPSQLGAVLQAKAVRQLNFLRFVKPADGAVAAQIASASGPDAAKPASAPAASK